MADLALNGILDSPSRSVTARAVVDAAGRLVVPARFRAALGFGKRQEVLLTLEGTAVRLVTAEAAVDAAVAEVQALARKYGGGKGGEVDAFIAERRAEAAKE